ncbi:MAG: ATP-dependent 6-phosphofructokinase [Kiritimatiellae bacterium]|nr:ATP-dependent 6-phosphofructokinase [Kiritimatiellia bacterium]
MKNDFIIKELGIKSHKSPLRVRSWAQEDVRILIDAAISSDDVDKKLDTLEVSGPHRRIFFDPADTRVAIVTCGGLCPGLNDVIRATTMVFWHRYGVKDILGIRYGYEGLVESYGHEPIKLTPEVVEDIHQKGGTILGSSRGQQDTGEIVDYLEANNINILFTVGGDGTQRAAMEIADEVEKRKLPISVIGIPKTIDNDVAFTERTFGFETAVALCQTPITCAHMEAKAVRNGVGLVKLMGRDAGFVAAYATLASSDVNLLLIPEIDFTLEKVMEFLETRLENKNHAVIIVAEGAGKDILPSEGKDKSGNVKFGDIGIFLKDEIKKHFKSKQKEINVKYIDPSYIIRSAPANANDSVFCFQLAGNAVHAAMAGKTAMVVGLWNGQYVNVPMERTVSSRKTVDLGGHLATNLLDNTGQPKLV